MRVCKEWGSLLLNEDVKVVCDDQKATDWIGSFFSSTNFMAQAQTAVVRAFGLGTGAWALWVDLDRKKVRIRHYDARMVIPLHVGRGRGCRVSFRHAGVLPWEGHRPAADASEGRHGLFGRFALIGRFFFT